MAELGCPRAAAGPVVAGMVGGVGVRAPIRLRSGEDIVLIRSVAEAFGHLAFFRERRGLTDAIAHARLLQRIAVQLGETGRDLLALGVSPGTVPDAIPRIHRARTLRAEIRMPRAAAASGRRREHLAMHVRSRQSAQVGSFACAHAGDEETHRRWRAPFALTAFSLAECER